MPLGGAQLCLRVADLAMLGLDAFDDPGPHQRRSGEPGSLGVSTEPGRAVGEAGHKPEHVATKPDLRC